MKKKIIFLHVTLPLNTLGNLEWGCHILWDIKFPATLVPVCVCWLIYADADPLLQGGLRDSLYIYGERAIETCTMIMKIY